LSFLLLCFSILLLHFVHISLSTKLLTLTLHVFIWLEICVVLLFHFSFTSTVIIVYRGEPVLEALKARQDDPSELVREHVAWALAQHQARQQG